MYIVRRTSHIDVQCTMCNVLKMKTSIIHFLKQTEEYLSGEEISRHLKMSRAAVWKYIEELRKDGYEIEAIPHRGYKLLTTPDLLLPHEIQFNLGTKTIGKEFIYHESISSTMDLAFKLGMEGAKEGTVVCAETQTKGRGRMGRSWVSPKGKGIYFSLILRPSLTPTESSKFTLLAGVAVSEAIHKVCGIRPGLKWPNDLLIHHKKLAGILTELSAEMDRVRFIVIGIGLNVNTMTSQLPSIATSLKAEVKQNVNRVDVLQEILRQFEKYYFEVKVDGFDTVIKKARQLSATIGTRIKLVDAGKELEGQAIDIDDQGALVIRSDAGVAIKRMTGDVIHVA